MLNKTILRESFVLEFRFLGKIVCQRFFNLGFDFVIDRVAVEDPFAL